VLYRTFGTGEPSFGYSRPSSKAPGLLFSGLWTAKRTLDARRGRAGPCWAKSDRFAYLPSKLDEVRWSIDSILSLLE